MSQAIQAMLSNQSEWTDAQDTDPMLVWGSLISHLSPDSVSNISEGVLAGMRKNESLEQLLKLVST